MRGTMRLLAVTTFWGLLASSSMATTIAYDPFNSGVGSLGGAESTSPGFWPTNGQQWSNVDGLGSIASGSLVSPTLTIPTDGNRASLASDGSQVAGFRAFGTTFNNGSNSELWFSFLYGAGDGINEGISLYSGGASGNEEMFFGGTGGGVLAIRALGGRSVTGGDQFANSGVTAVASTTYLIVARVAFGSSYTIWVNPTGESLGLPTGGSTASITANLQNFSLDTIRLGIDGPDGSVAQFDEFRMGTTYAAVVPEPATLALLGSGGLAALFLPRCRRRGD